MNFSLSSAQQQALLNSAAETVIQQRVENFFPSEEGYGTKSVRFTFKRTKEGLPVKHVTVSGTQTGFPSVPSFSGSPLPRSPSVLTHNSMGQLRGPEFQARLMAPQAPQHPQSIFPQIPDPTLRLGVSTPAAQAPPVILCPPPTAPAPKPTPAPKPKAEPLRVPSCPAMDRVFTEKTRDFLASSPRGLPYYPEGTLVCPVSRPAPATTTTTSTSVVCAGPAPANPETALVCAVSFSRPRYVEEYPALPAPCYELVKVEKEEEPETPIHKKRKRFSLYEFEDECPVSSSSDSPAPYKVPRKSDSSCLSEFINKYNPYL